MLHPGLYEQVINNALTGELAEIPEARKSVAPIDKAEASKVLAQYLADVVQKGLDNVLDNGGDISAQIGLTNQIVDLIQNTTKEADFAALGVDQRAEQLLALLRETDPRLAVGKTAADIERPETSIAQSSLFTGAVHEPQMFTELKKEIVSADRIDMLVSFIKWSGLRLIMDELREFTHSGGELRIVQPALQFLLHNPVQVVLHGDLDTPGRGEQRLQHIFIRFSAPQIHQFFLTALEYAHMVDQKENILTMSHLRTFDELPQLGPVFRHPLHLDREMRRKSVFVIEVIPESLRTAAGQTLVDSIGTLYRTISAQADRIDENETVTINLPDELVEFAQFGRIIFEIRKNLSPALRISQITTHAASPLSDDLPVGGIRNRKQ